MKTLLEPKRYFEEPLHVKGPWDNEIRELQQFYQEINVPDGIKLDKCSQITDAKLFVDSHLSIVKGQNGNERYLPYLNRLTLLKFHVEIKNVRYMVKNDAIQINK